MQPFDNLQHTRLSRMTALRGYALAATLVLGAAPLLDDAIAFARWFSEAFGLTS